MGAEGSVTADTDTTKQEIIFYESINCSVWLILPLNKAVSRDYLFYDSEYLSL